MHVYCTDYTPYFAIAHSPGKPGGRDMTTERSERRGILTILATVGAMALADAVVKLSSATLPLWQIWVLRSMLTVPVLLFMARGCLRPAGLPWVILRAALLALMYLGIYGAMPLLDLSVIAAALYTGPLFIVGLTALVLGESITRLQGLAILGAFLGVLVILRPLASGFTPLALLPVGAALLYALAAILTRTKLAAVPAMALALWLNLTCLLAGCAVGLAIRLGLAPPVDYPFLFGHWQTMTLGDWQVIAALAVLMVATGIGLARAYQSPRPQVIATLDYAYLIFAAFWGRVFFGEIPDIPTVLGIALIIACGLMAAAPFRAQGNRADDRRRGH